MEYGIKEGIKTDSISKIDAKDQINKWIKKQPWNKQRLARLLKWIGKY